MKLETCRVAVGPAERRPSRRPRRHLKAAQAAVVDAEKDAEAAAKTARKIERDRAGKVEELDAMFRREDGVGETVGAAER